MGLDQEQIISANVIMRPASGKEITGETVITSENIQNFQPAPEAVTEASKIFADLGFGVGQAIGISFPITGTVSTFERVFDTRLAQEKRGGIEAILKDGSRSQELPLEALPARVPELVLTVAFARAPDFGPTEFFGP